MKRTLASILALVFCATASAGTTPLTLDEVDLEKYYGPIGIDARLDEAFHRLRLAAKAKNFPLERWFRDTHYVYVRELLVTAHKAGLLEAFRQVRQRIENGDDDWRAIYSETAHPEIVAEVAAIDNRVLALKRLHKIVIRLALAKHETERKQRYGEEAYSYHLRSVRRVLKRFGFGPKDSFFGLQLGTAAWLHDILEDTDLTRETLEKLVGREIADAVYGVTNAEKREGESKLDHKRRTLRKTRLLKMSRILKLADRIANVEEGILRLFLGGQTKVQKYIEEQPFFRRYLYRRGEADAMWTHLDRLLTDVDYAQAFARKHLAHCAAHLAR